MVLTGAFLTFLFSSSFRLPDPPAFSSFSVQKMVADDDGSGLFATGDTVTYTILIMAGQNVISGTFNLLDTLPAGLAYVPGSTSWVNPGGGTAPIPDNAQGTPFPLDGSNNLVGNSAPLFPGDTIRISFRAVITSAIQQVITNRVKVWQGNTVQFAEVSMEVFPVVSLGNRVWYDFDLDGFNDHFELGLNGVALSLYSINYAGGAGNLIDTTLIARDTTAGGGYYLFEEVLPGDYFVALDESNFAPGAGFFRFRTSEITEFNPNLNGDRNDNGINIPAPGLGFFSRIISLSYGEEPTGEVQGPEGTGGMPDNASNLTLDFGLYEPPPFDLALKKEIASELTPGPFYPGDSVTFRITLENQAVSTAYNIEVIDYIPEGLILLSHGWEGFGDFVKTEMDGPLYNGQQAELLVTFQIDSTFRDTVLINRAEIMSADDDPFFYNGLAVDLDSPYDTDPDNDGGGLPGSDADDALHGDGSGAPGTGDADTDEDDADPALVVVQQPFDLALSKTLAPGQPALFAVGDSVVFQITLYNEGTRDAFGVEIEDRLPDGLSLLGFYSDSGGFSQTGAAVFHLDTLPAGDSIGLTLFTRIEPGFQGASLTNVAEIVLDNGDDEDSTPNNQIADEDDQDAVTIAVEQIYDLALQKSLTPGQNGSFVPGGLVSFTVTLANEGTLHAYFPRIRDRFPSQMAYVGSDADGINVQALGSGLFRIPFLAAGESISFTVLLTINEGFEGYSLTNVAEVIFDDGADVDSTPNNNLPAEDDQDQVTVDVQQTFDLALAKGLANGQAATVLPGETVQFQLTLVNEGTLTATNTMVTDFLPPGLSYLGSDADGLTVVALGNGVFRFPSLAPGHSRSVVLTATLDPDYQDYSLLNIAEITGDSGSDADSTPGNNLPAEDDQAALAVDVEQTFDLALTKTLAPGQPATVTPGGEISFLLTLTNEGSLHAYDVTVTDRFPDVMAYLASDADGTQVVDFGNGVFLIPTLLAGQSITIEVTLLLPFGFQGQQLVNVAEVTADNGDDLDSVPGNNEATEDDQDAVTFQISHTFDLALTKALAPGQPTPVEPGQTVSFLLTLTNQGTLDAGNTLVTDLLPPALAYAGSDADGIIIVDQGNGAFAVGSLPAGSSISWTLQTIIDPAFTGFSLTNTAEITEDNGNDADSTPGNGLPGEDDQSQVTIPVDQPFDLALGKQLAAGQPTSFVPGQTVQFLLTLTNEGLTPAFNTQVQDFLPPMLTYVSSNADGVNVQDLGDGLFQVNELLPGESRGILLSLLLDPSFQGSQFINEAEIMADSGEDEDSTPGNGAAAEDDRAVVLVEVSQTYDLALRKELAPGQDGPFFPGDEITFLLTVENQGTLHAQQIAVTDHFPPEMSYVSSSADGVALLDNGDGAFLVPYLPAGESLTFTVVLRIEFGFQGDELVNVAEIAADDGDDVDSVPGNNDATEDDQDQLIFPVEQRYDLALAKVLTPGQPSPVPPGATVDFLLSVTNQGTLDAAFLEVTDFLPAGLLYMGSDANGIDVMEEGAGIFMLPALPAGATISFTVQTQVENSYAGFSLTNIAEITSADGTDWDSTPGNGQAGEDDLAQSTIAIDQPFDLALSKALAPGQPAGFFPGDQVSFIVTVYNQGLVDAFDTEVTDRLPDSLLYVGSNADGQTVVDNGGGVFTIPFLAAGDSIAFTLTTIIQPGFQGLAMDNIVEITAAQEEDEDSTPDNGMFEEDDLDQVRFNVDQSFDLALAKTLSPIPGGPYYPGDQVAFELVLTNEGTLHAYDISLSDHLPAGLIYLGSDADGVSIVETGAGAFLAPSLLYGQSISLQVYAQIDPGFTGDTLFNEAEIMAADGLDEDSTPGNGMITEDDMAEAAVPVTQIFDLALTKQLSPLTPGPLAPGDTVIFRLRVINQGTLPAFNVEITDYLPAGLELIDPAWTLSGNLAVRTVAGPIPPQGGVATLNIMTRVPVDYDQPTLVNRAEISGADDDNDPTNGAPADWDSVFDQLPGNDAGGQPGSPADNAVDGDGTGQPGDGIAATDEDDSDPCLITLCGYNAGTDGFLQACRGCDQTAIVLDLAGALGGNPDPGGIWLDDDNTGVDLTDPQQVNFAGTAPGLYSFTYALGDPAVCVNAQSQVLVQITALGNLVCNNAVSVSLGPDCQAIVIPDMILEGNDNCAALLEVHLINEQGVNIGNTITSSEVGQTLIAQILDPDCNNFCLGNITVHDYLPPVISCPPDLGGFICTDADTLYNNPATLTVTGEPVVLDNCTDDPVVTFIDQLSEGPECGADALTRTFTVTDASGNSAQCSQIITIGRAALSDVVFPPASIALSCDDDFPLDAEGLPAPGATGLPGIQSFFGLHTLFQSYCNFGSFYEDTPPAVFCDGSYSFVRSWTVINWCNPSELTTVNQVVMVEDETGPVVSCPEVDYDLDGQPDPMVFSTGPFDCTAAFAVPLPAVSDNCSSWTVRTEIVTDTIVEVTNPFGQVVGLDTQLLILRVIEPGQPLFVAGIRQGCHRFRYTVTDDCGNTTIVACDFCVEDQVEPIAICDNEVTVSVGGQNFARIFAVDLDEGSWDNCGVDRIEVRRMITTDPATCDPAPSSFTDWAPFVDFNCCDVGAVVPVQLRITDIYGNTNGCITNVVVVDFVNPFCSPPPAISVDCDALPAGFDASDPGQLASLFGAPTITDNCQDAGWEELTPNVSLDDCGFGSIIRRFRGVDASGNMSTNTCQQLVTVTEIHDYQIKFPADAMAACGQPDVEGLEFSSLACDLLAVSVTDLTFTPAGDECFQVFRTYRVINWCEYDGIADPVIVPRDVDCDGAPGDEDLWVLVRRNGQTFYDRDSDENNGLPVANTRGTACGPNNPAGYWLDSGLTPGITSRGFWEYTQHIKVYDDTDPQISFLTPAPFCSYNNNACTAPVSVGFSLSENCLPGGGGALPANVTVRVLLDLYADGVEDGDITDQALAGNFPDYDILGTYPLGAHHFQVIVSDGCGNQATASIPFEVVDCKAPTPVCLNGLSVNLSPLPAGTDADGDGDEDYAAVTLAVTDFLTGTTVADCNGPVSFSINFSGETPDPTRDSITITCDEGNLVFVEIYGWDEAFNPYAVQPDGTLGGPNYDFCETYALVLNGPDACQPPLGPEWIMGMVTNELYAPIEGVMVSLSGQSDAEMETLFDGTYYFANLEEGYDFTVSPLLDTLHGNGVSTLDIVYIEQHILGTQSLDSPYKMIAADVNRSGSITVTDLIQIRRIVLGQDSVFSNNTSWRFVEEAFNFPDPTNPWATFFPEVISINDLIGDVTDADFIGIKTGDVSLNAATSYLLSAEERNSAGDIALQVTDRSFTAGELVEADFRLAAAHEVMGCQFTLRFDPAALEWMDLQPGLANSEHFGQHLVGDGILTFSWSDQGAPLPVSVAEPVFSLTFRARRDGSLQDFLRMDDKPTPAEAYSIRSEWLGISLQFQPEPSTSLGPIVYAGRPNPFREHTVLPFYLPEPGMVTLTIYDKLGREWRREERDGQVGYQEWRINGKDLPVSGLLLCVLETNSGRSTFRLLKLP